ncbi:MAG: hypothetical protein L0221_08500, partial [Chloroflexi bacterium]|nr:hypothetical protein [Chloroflexota bacterium]
MKLAPGGIRDIEFSVQLLQLVHGRADPALRLFAESLNFYDGDPATAGGLAFQGLPFGTVGRYGAVTRSETLVLSEARVAAAYGASPPPYLTPGRVLTASADYPAGFVQQLPPGAGYVFHAAGGPYAGGYYATTQSRRFDFHGAGPVRGLVLEERDPLGATTLITYDQPYNALPASTTDAAGLSTRVAYDYRVMRPRLLTDANDNETRVEFAPIGLVSAVWQTGKPNEGQGDLGRPSTRFEYDFRAFLDGKLADPPATTPVFVRIVRSTHHDSDADDRGEVVESRDYSDGFGRLLQTRTQAETVRFGDAAFGGGDGVLPASQADGRGGDVAGAAVPDRVVVSGAQRFDNKGRTVVQYEPFFSIGWRYAPPREAADPAGGEYGVGVEMVHDPRGRLVRTVNGDGSERRVVHGVPRDLADPTDPDRITPTPWETYTYDANDNAGRTHPQAATSYRHHWNTPASIVVDALGRTVVSVARNRAKPAQPTDPLAPIDEYVTRYSYDIQGNLLALTDPLNRTAVASVYDLARHAVHTSSLDTGERSVVFDAAGREIERRDSKGARALRSYDALGRPDRVWARNGAGERMTLRARVEYGDGGTPT